MPFYLILDFSTILESQYAAHAQPSATLTFKHDEKRHDVSEDQSKLIANFCLLSTGNELLKIQKATDPSDRTSNQSRIPAEFKHITRWRKALPQL